MENVLELKIQYVEPTVQSVWKNYFAENFKWKKREVFIILVNLFYILSFLLIYSVSFMNMEASKTCQSIVMLPRLSCILQVISCATMR